MPRDKHRLHPGRVFVYVRRPGLLHWCMRWHVCSMCAHRGKPTVLPVVCCCVGWPCPRCRQRRHIPCAHVRARVHACMQACIDSCCNSLRFFFLTLAYCWSPAWPAPPPASLLPSDAAPSDSASRRSTGSASLLSLSPRPPAAAAAAASGALCCCWRCCAWCCCCGCMGAGAPADGARRAPTPSAATIPPKLSTLLVGLPVPPPAHACSAAGLPGPGPVRWRFPGASHRCTSDRASGR